MSSWFQSRNRREQLLVTLFVIMGALIWLSSAAGRLNTRLSTWRSTHTDLGAQQLWLDRQKEIEESSLAAVRNLDPARTFDATKLVATVTSLASGASLQPTIDSPVTQRTNQFALHTIKVTFRRANLPALLNFYDELSKQAPYLNLESVALQTDRSAAGALNATLQISATQIVKP
ncbi:MAG: general secretion pathway protein GspM [Lacunisphaera sp.]|nr:general secretion pathway protein GspM [Lacunisphaera sp.]